MMDLKRNALVLGALFFAAASIAVADPVPGSVNVSGHDTFSTSSLTFISPFASLGDSGFFSSFANGTVTYYLGTVNPLGSTSLLKVFSVTSTGGDVLTFYTQHNGATPFTDASTGFLDLTLDETGYYTINGGPNLSGFFDVTFYGTSATGAVAGQAFSGSGGLLDALDPVGIAPEPSSDLLLGTAVFAMASCWFYSRRRLSHMSA